MSYSFFVTVSKGLEELIREELTGILASSIEAGRVRFGDPKADRGGVGFTGEVEDALRVCLFSRVATRVYLRLKEFSAPTPEKLYGGVKSIKWSDHFTVRETIAIDFVSKNSGITHTHYGALKAKDAICDQFRSNTGERPSVDVQDPDIQIQIYVNRDVATVNLDLSGPSLHERGYRRGAVEAPLKENLGAALLILAGWPKLCEQKGAAFLDAMCGSGTLPIEAAWIARNRAPGILRRRWGFQKWKAFDAEIWERLKAEARAAERPCSAKIFGSDQGSNAFKSSVANAEAAGVAEDIHFERREFTSWTVKPAEKGLLLMNPPYGERLGDEDDLIPLYGAIGDTMKKVFTGWEGGVFTANAMLAKEVGLKPNRRIPLWNGALECRLFTYSLFQGYAPGSKARKVEDSGSPEKAEG